MNYSVPNPPLIQQHQIDNENGKVTFIMPKIDSRIASSVESEVRVLSGIDQMDITFEKEADTVTVTIKNTDTPALARDVAKLMCRRVQIFDTTSNGKPIHYAASDDINSVLGNLRDQVKTTSPHAARVIESLISVTKQFERM